MEDTCPRCKVVGDYPEEISRFVPTLIWCGNCGHAFPPQPSVLDILLAEPCPGVPQEVRLKPRWRKPFLTGPAQYSSNEVRDTRPPWIRDEKWLEKQTVFFLIQLLRGLVDWDHPFTEKQIRDVLKTKPHYETDSKKASKFRSVRAQRRHGMSKSRDR